MTVTERLQKRISEYRAYAATAAAGAADASALTSVRAGHARAEQRWLELAQIDDERLRTYHT